MKTLMIQGTTSDAGKSTVVAGLCRVFVNRGFKVAPFKPQNMALNSAVTEDGGEIGRAQALQAIAANIAPRGDFNPILLKPNSDTGAQFIVHGKAISNMEASSYHDYKKVAMNAVVESHHRLAKEFDVLMVEGAGSPAEINLRQHDLANMGYAEKVDCPVILVADIDRGGVFAHLVGTLELLSESEQARVKGFIINRFRGDIKLLESGLTWLEERTGKPVLGVLPYLHDLALDAEDAIAIDNTLEDCKVTISVLLIPHISNHTDFDTLRLQPNIDLRYVKIGQKIPPSDLIILPGSKNVISDLAFLRSQDWQTQIKQHLRYGGKVLGICGGYQMLGNRIEDPFHVEGNIDGINGLGLFNMTTSFLKEKCTTQSKGVIHNLEGEWSSLSNIEVEGYEIHMGDTVSKEKPLIKNDSNTFDGSIKGNVIGSYFHGIFDNRDFLSAIINKIKTDKGIKHEGDKVMDFKEYKDNEFNKLASSDVNCLITSTKAGWAF